MDFLILSLLNRQEVTQIAAELANVPFVEGKATASGVAAAVKHNRQVDRSANTPLAADGVVTAALGRCQRFQAFTVPKRILAPTFARYEPGMEYGSHIDAAVMGSPTPVRTDFAMTVFLSPPDTYDGGELIIESLAGEQEIKLPVGEAVIYPATSVHRVAPVTRGVRLVAVTWIQSAVRDGLVRSVLYDLSEAVNVAAAAGDTAMVVRLSKCHNNLLRSAAEF